ncbi:hypothetical protein [Phorcysia thermohydrogeniphila]|uniref:Lipoprotein n=1 Tax=Phorcysia thermohydrogeniphila TaxID=936138 RepID=A0A4R1G604_9BACT|nr:hypothetical protein [Phorcysia thermohydrogeniphila]TCK03387.1 hypothetical protein CLV27_1461 [Phorcysia thermohydrogeniphila]
MKKLLYVTTCLSLMLASCGSPRYIVKYKYVPPQNSKECLKSCEVKFEECQKSCNEKFQRCINKSWEEARKIYQAELLSYRKELSAYREKRRNYLNDLIEWNEQFKRVYRDYRFFSSICRRTKERYACERKRELRELLDTVKAEKPKKPSKPKEPSLDSIFREISSKCTTQCGCQELFNNCFVSCGGKLIPYKMCIENCE